MTRDDPLIVVLGGTGYLGSSLVSRLAALGVRTRAVGRRQAWRTLPLIEHVRADVTCKTDLAAVVREADAVVHLVALLSGGRSWRVAEDDPEGHRVTVQPMYDLLDITGADRRAPLPIVTAGTTTIAGCPDRARLDGTEPDRPGTAYDRHKQAVERALLTATESGVALGVPLRLPTVYGAGAGSPGSGVVSAMAARAVAGLPLTMWHDGSVLRDLVHVSDVASALWLAVRHAAALGGRTWLIGSGDAIPLGDVLRMIAAATTRWTRDAPVPVVRVDPPEYATPADFCDVEVDPGPFTAITGWRATVRLEDGVDAVVRATLAETDRYRDARKPLPTNRISPS
ncbi:NAD-dependent epimerase/dehydratase family protein [Amycolatopsis sp. QT-25]|uniref:NAD-dependent epimerase/dehydratase family protein n=1 Tax=Amycolatopsis sp. QT-25 TaxID=3034022 RepID=UPI0023ED3A0C|nr:NAD-dependent epimerase/dehydratase family protein [Amycolatopsis sp. QT-25]WET76807.1 NAD-dependent epimerase/dehydratase family protein [Amycolatopsis sp. QT-25]